MSSHVRQDSETISQGQRSSVAKRYITITKAINSEFWNSISEARHSLYAESYGRSTAIDTGDPDVFVRANCAGKYISAVGLTESGVSLILRTRKQFGCAPL